MNDLMIHVESIVRPIRATQSRKLRMRRELLTHLQSAYDEELAGHPDNALDRAKQRLGSPAALTAQLQQSVPFLQRLLLSRLPTPHAYDRWELRAVGRLWGIARPQTLAHVGLLCAAAVCLPYAAGLMMVLRAGHPSTYFATLLDHPTATLLADLALLAIILLLFFLSGRFITTTVARDSSSPRRSTFFLGLSIATLLILTLLTCVLGLARHPLTLPDLATAAITISALLLSLHLTGRLLATLQRPYQDWLTLPLPE